MKKRIFIFVSAVSLFLAACSNPAGKEEKTEPVSQQTQTEGELQETGETKGNRIQPLPTAIDLERLTDCSVAASLEEGDIYLDDTGKLLMKMTVYDYELFDLVDISQMKEGDILCIRNQDMEVTSLEQDESGVLYVNGGLESGGCTLWGEGGVYFELTPNDLKMYYELGEATIPVSENFVFTDQGDLEKGEITLYAGDFLMPDMEINYTFTPYNTTVVIENGYALAMNRIFVP